MQLKYFILLTLSFPIHAVITPDEFIDNYIKEKEHGDIYKIDLLIYKNQFIEEVDLKEQWKTLEPLNLNEELFMINDQATLLVEKPIFKEKSEDNIITLHINDLIEDLPQNKENVMLEGQVSNRLKFNLFERIPYEKELEKIRKKLDLNRDYKVLHSISWYQPLAKKNESVFIYIENSNVQFKTYGEVLIYKDKYLHFDAKLRLSEITDFVSTESISIKTIDFNKLLTSKFVEEKEDKNNRYWMETIFKNIKVNIGDFSKWILNNDLNSPKLNLGARELIDFQYNDLYEIKQEIKIEDNKYHFIDHPYFGVIIRISSL